MTFPQLKNKHLEKSIYTVEDWRKYAKDYRELSKKGVPKNVILCYSRKFLKEILHSFGTKKLSGPYGDFYAIKKSDFGVLGNFGIGSPVSSIIMEELIGLGVRNFLIVGTGGALQKNLKLGDVVICIKAIRDEGTSHHYLRHSKYAFPSTNLTNKVEHTLHDAKIKFVRGSSWTIDAPYRETVKELVKYRREGVLTVEMEASALFSIGKYRNVNVAAIFIISDLITETNWKPAFDSKTVHNSLLSVFRACVNGL